MSRALARWAFDSRGPRATVLVRFALGLVFVSEGIQKFLFASELGVGRFAKIGIPLPQVTAPFVGVVEIVGGLLLALGFATRVVCIPMLVDMAVAITSTKLVTLGKVGLWKTLHEARTDLLMLCCLLFVLFVGAGPLSMDRGWDPARGRR